MYIFYAIFQARPTSLEVYYFEYNFICGVQRHKRQKYDKSFSFTQKPELGWWLYTLKMSGVWAPSLSACCPHPKGQMADHHVCFPKFCSHPIDHPSVTWTLPAAKEAGKFSLYSGSHVLLWSFYQYQNQYWDNSQTLPLKALLKSIEFRFWNKIDYSSPITALHHMVSEFQLTMTANFRRPHLAGRRALWYALWLYHAISTCGSSNESTVID